MKASRIAADYLQAQNAEIGSLMVAEPVKTKHGDIAYHFILKNPDDHPEFDEGEIVGLFVNESGTRVLDKLSQKNSLDAILKGVITRSYYLEAHVQPKGGNLLVLIVKFEKSLKLDFDIWINLLVIYLFLL